MTRPVLAAVAEQQKIIQSLQGEVARLRAHAAKQDLVVAFICKMAGLTEHVAAIEKHADAANPAQPVPDPPGAAPSETTDQARTPEASDDPRQLGATPGSNQNIGADSTDVALAPGQSLPTPPYGDLEDVSAPVAGTETHVPNDQTRLEVDVRVGDPDNPEQAYPWHLDGGEQQAVSDVSPADAAVNRQASLDRVQSSNRTMASLHLARLRLAAGIARGDDLEIAATSYFHALQQDDIPFLLLFSGTIFTRGETGFSVAQVPWHKEATYRVPVTEWRAMMDAFYPNSG
jgi:hypothetical protein